MLKIGVQAIVTPPHGGGSWSCRRGAASVTGPAVCSTWRAGRIRFTVPIQRHSAGAAGLYGAFSRIVDGQALGISSVSSFVSTSASYAAGGTDVATGWG